MHWPWIYLGLFPDKMAPCFLQVTRGGGTPLTMHSSTAGLLMFTDTAWEPCLIVGATERLNDKCRFLNSLIAVKWIMIYNWLIYCINNYFLSIWTFLIFPSLCSLKEEQRTSFSMTPKWPQLWKCFGGATVDMWNIFHECKKHSLWHASLIYISFTCTLYRYNTKPYHWRLD